MTRRTALLDASDRPEIPPKIYMRGARRSRSNPVQSVEIRRGISIAISVCSAREAERSPQ